MFLRCSTGNVLSQLKKSFCKYPPVEMTRRKTESGLMSWLFCDKSTKSEVPELLNDWPERVITGQTNVRLVSKKLHYEKVVYSPARTLNRTPFLFLSFQREDTYNRRTFLNWLKTFSVELRKNIRRAISFTICIQENAIAKIQWLQKTGDPV